MNPQPQFEHDWLSKLVGEWSYESDCVMEPGQPPVRSTGIETVRSLGGLWVLCEGRGAMPDGPQSTNVMTLGFDPQKQRFVGTFIASIMTYLWIYEGALDDSGRVLTLDAEGPSFSGDGKLAKYKDVIEWKSDDHRVLVSSCLGDDGASHLFMTAHYRRKA